MRPRWSATQAPPRTWRRRRSSAPGAGWAASGVRARSRPGCTASPPTSPGPISTGTAVRPGSRDRSLDDEAEPLQAGDVPSPAPDAETSLVRREAIDRALSELPDELRLALVLRGRGGAGLQGDSRRHGSTDRNGGIADIPCPAPPADAAAPARDGLAGARGTARRDTDANEGETDDLPTGRTAARARRRRDARRRTEQGPRPAPGWLHRLPGRARHAARHAGGAGRPAADAGPARLRHTRHGQPAGAGARHGGRMGSTPWTGARGRYAWRRSPGRCSWGPHSVSVRRPRLRKPGHWNSPIWAPHGFPTRQWTVRYKVPRWSKR